MARVESVHVFHPGHVAILCLFPVGFFVELNSKVQRIVWVCTPTPSGIRHSLSFAARKLPMTVWRELQGGIL